jgi:quinol monooxygenase YgiN
VLVVVWEYEVRPGCVEDFETLYRPDGAWSDFFRASPAFVSTTLMKDLRAPHRYLVADRWTSESVYEDFKRDHAAAYDALSARGARLHAMEREVGRFDFRD